LWVQPTVTEVVGVFVRFRAASGRRKTNEPEQAMKTIAPKPKCKPS
jgi:hypothetical protein